jgi:hypothetical protein
MPNALWPLLHQYRELLHDLAALGASVIKRWVHAYYGVTPIIVVIPHTFGRRLNFHPHLHILVSAGGLDKQKSNWVHFHHFDKYALMYWWRFAVVRYLAEVLGADIENTGALDETLKQQSKRAWNIHIKRFSSKSHFLRYAGRYLRRPPIAEHRIISVTNHQVEFWANDLKLKAWVRIKVSLEEFLALLIQHVPDRYVNGIRYFGLLSPAGRHQLSTVLFALLGQTQRPRPKRVSFEQLIVRNFGYSPFIDSHGQRMRWVGRNPCPALAGAS